MTRTTIQKSIRLSDLDKTRLEEHARWFGMSLLPEENLGYTLRFLEGATFREIALGAESAHLRVLAELCSRTAQWICYAVGDTCANVYLGHSDLRIRRLAELYDQRTESADALP
jgi:hypothetical protein